MDNILEIVLNKYEVFLFVFIRMSGIFIITPIFSRRNIPNTTKIVFTFFIALLMINTVNMANFDYGEFDIIVMMIKELMVGLMIGFITYLFFISLYIAGQIMDMQIGFGMVNVFDPQSNAQVPIIGTLYHILAILFFLTIDGHHILIKSLINSYEVLPIGKFVFNEALLTQIIRVFGQIFIIGFKISSPILATIFLSNVLLGILARTIPQMNVFVVGMPLKITVGILTLIVMVPLYLPALQHIFDNMYEEIFNFLKIIGEGW